LDTLILSNRITLLFSSELIQEIAKTSGKPKLRKFFDENSLIEMLLAFEDYMEIIEVKSDIAICRDRKDDFLLNLALDGKANFLITGDHDLLVLSRIENTKITSLSSFILSMK
jgi:hypothetical protein